MEKRHVPLDVRNKNKKKINIKYYHVLLTPYIVFLLAFVIAPMFIIVLNSFTPAGSTSTIPSINFTLEHFVRVFVGSDAGDSGLFSLMLQSLRIALIVTTITILVAYPIAYWISKRKPAIQSALILLITAPMWINMLLRILAVRQMFDAVFQGFADSLGITSRLVHTDFALYFGMVYIYLPFMVLPIYAFLSQMDKRLLEASTDLGGSRIQTFKKVILPLSIPGILSGVTIVLLGSATQIALPTFLGGNTRMIGQALESMFIGGSTQWLYGSAVGLILLLLIMMILWIIKKVDKNRGYE